MLNILTQRSLLTAYMTKCTGEWTGKGSVVQYISTDYYINYVVCMYICACICLTQWITVIIIMHKCIQLLLMQGVFEEVQSAFSRYGIEVVAWEDVPTAVQTLAHKQGKDPLPDRELCLCLQTACGACIQTIHMVALIYTALTSRAHGCYLQQDQFYRWAGSVHFHGCTTNQAS